MNTTVRRNQVVHNLADMVERIAHYLPQQAPIRRFVHHNTLHAFEHLSFEQAVVKAAKLFDCEPFPTEEYFKEQWQEQRIAPADLEAVLPENPKNWAFKGWTVRDFQLFRLQHFLPQLTPAEVTYRMTEGAELEQFTEGLSSDARQALLEQGSCDRVLKQLWKGLSFTALPQKVSQPDGRKQELEHHIHPLLIRFCGVYLDQGIAYWPLLRQEGVYRTFLSLYGQSSHATLPWMKGLSKRLRGQWDQGWSGERALQEGLKELSIPESDWEQACLERGLALRGWAGMIYQFEVRPDRAPIQAPPCRLLDYLAVYFQLEAHLEKTLPPSRSARFPRHAQNLPLVYEAFRLAQLAGLGPSELCGPQEYQTFMDTVAGFPSLERRKVLFQAYEHHYLTGILEALAGHHEQGEYRRRQAPRFQAVFCIDDREESLRRHLEELSPEVETFGFAGFFNVPMVYQSLDDVHATPLCPVTIRPHHLVREITIDESLEYKRATRKKRIGTLNQTARAHRTSLVGGLFLNSLVGFLAGIPLIAKTVFPGLARRFGHALEHSLVGRIPTRLKVQRDENEGPNEEGYLEGFTVQEMSRIVAGALGTMGARKLSPLFVVVGHGSSSLNNPHEAAHDCGATGGGRGGPNARAFAMMANHPEVRRSLADEGLEIPDQTWFLGAYHNTCDDSMTYYDTDLVPDRLAQELQRAQELLHQACVLDAHERCRRFENVPLEISPARAYEHVLARAEELAQPRPEYGHCTNSLCLVGRRDRTRGVFLDRRAFLVSYDPETDPEGETLGRLLESVGPVGAGINLEYYFSAVDKSGYGCGTKLPHNVTGLIGVMDGYSSDLRSGLPWQMVELHEPMRLFNIVEAEPQTLSKILREKPGLRALVERGWIWLVAQSPKGRGFWIYRNGQFEPFVPRDSWIETADNSRAYYSGKRGHLPCAQIRSGLREAK